MLNNIRFTRRAKNYKVVGLKETSHEEKKQLEIVVLSKINPE